MTARLALLALMTAAHPALAEIADPPTNIEAVYSDMKRFVEDLSHEEATSKDLAEDYYASMPVQGQMDKAFFQESLANPYRKNVAMNDLGAVALAAWGSIGTAEQAAQVLGLRQRADALDATGDPQYADIASKYRQEATAIENMDDAGAKDLADSVAHMDRPDASNYSPTAEDKTFARKSNAMTAKVVGGVVRVVAANVVGAIIGAYYGCTSCGLAIGGAVGGVADEGIQANNSGDEDQKYAAGEYAVDTGADLGGEFAGKAMKDKLDKIEADANARQERDKATAADSKNSGPDGQQSAGPALPTGGSEKATGMNSDSAMPGAK